MPSFLIIFLDLDFFKTSMCDKIWHLSEMISPVPAPPMAAGKLKSFLLYGERFRNGNFRASLDCYCTTYHQPLCFRSKNCEENHSKLQSSRETCVFRYFKNLGIVWLRKKQAVWNPIFFTWLTLSLQFTCTLCDQCMHIFTDKVFKTLRQMSCFQQHLTLPSSGGDWSDPTSRTTEKSLSI